MRTTRMILFFTILLIAIAGISAFVGCSSGAGSSDYGWFSGEGTDTAPEAAGRASALFRIGGADMDRGETVAADAAGNIVVAGSFSDLVPFGSAKKLDYKESNGSTDVFVAKYDGTGSLMWSAAFGSVNADAAHSLKLDKSGNVYVTGYFEGDMKVSDSVTLNAAGSRDAFVIKLNPDGAVLWAFSLGYAGGSQGTAEGMDLAIAQNGALYVTGKFQGTADFSHGGGASPLTSNGASDIFVACYDLQGACRWAFALGSAGADEGKALALTSQGELLMAGIFQGEVDFDPGTGASTMTSGGAGSGTSICIARYDSGGTFINCSQVKGTEVSTGSGAIVVDSKGGFCLTGGFYGSADLGGGKSVTSRGDSDIFLACYNRSNALTWGFSVGGSGFDAGRALGTDEGGNIFVAGQFSGTLDADPGSGTLNLTAQSSAGGILLARYSRQGDIGWAQGFSGITKSRRTVKTEAGMNTGNGLAVQGSHAVMTGAFTGAVSFDGTGNSTLTSAGGSDIVVTRHHLGGALSDQLSMSIPPMSIYSFQYNGFNTDGTSLSNPVIYDSLYSPGNGLTYVLKRLTNNISINFYGVTYTVYSAVPDYMTISNAYTSSSFYGNYFDSGQITSNNIPALVPAGQLNNGQRSLYAVDTSRYENWPVWRIYNTDDSKFYLPNLCNTVDALHDGLTENVAWTVDPCYQSPFYPDSHSDYTGSHLIPNGWSFIPGNIQSELVWRNIQPDGGTEGTYFAIQQETGRNGLLDEIMVNYPLLGTGNTIQSLISTPWPFPIEPTSWLPYGIFLSYMACPGFQRNTLRNYTPWGTVTDFTNTSGVFVRNNGDVEIPYPPVPGSIDQAGQQAPCPLVMQTWDGDQRFVILNLTGQAIPSTTDDYPGLEYYYMGNTYLPQMAGILQFNKNYAINDNVQPAHMRASDCWLGYCGDQTEDVMNWITGNGQDPGGQGRKPYMVNGAQWLVSSTSGSTFKAYHISLLCSNSFFQILIPDAQAINTMYTATLYVDPRQGTYYPVCSLSYTYQTGLCGKVNGSGSTWTATAPAGQGSWMPQAQWLCNSTANFPPGWVVSTVTASNIDGTTYKQQSLQAPAFSGSDLSGAGDITLTCNIGKWLPNPVTGDYEINWTYGADYTSTNVTSGSVYSFNVGGDFYQDPPGTANPLRYLIVLTPQ
ncbi:MAG: hypothetical protein AB9903_04385 [Vulcanimicrobiota bacterium]